MMSELFRIHLGFDAGNYHSSYLSVKKHKDVTLNDKTEKIEAHYSVTLTLLCIDREDDN